MSRPTFSIITAARNARAALADTADSLCRQTAQQFEWLVIDGASTDDTVEWIRSFNLIEQFSWISEPDRGIADAWNKGLARARGDYVLLLNAGDRYTPNALEVFSKNVDPSRILCSHTSLVDIEGHRVGVLRAQPGKLWRGMHVPHNWCCVPAAIYKEFGGYRELPFAMDFDWFHRYWRVHGRQGFVVVDEVLGEYSLGGISDEHYRASFGANEQIMVECGTPAWLARVIRDVYVFRHERQRRRHAGQGHANG